MNLLKQLNGLWRRQEVEPLTPNEKAMYLEILKYINLNDRKQPVQISRVQMMAGTQLPEGSLSKARKKLVDKGYIEVQRGRRGHAPKYTVSLLYRNEDPNSIGNSIGNSIANGITNSIGNGIANGIGMSIGNSITSKKKKIKIKENIKESAERKCTPTLEEVTEYISSHHLKVDPEKFFDTYNSVGWRDKNGNPITQWKGKVRLWHNANDSASEEDYDKVRFRKTELKSDRIYFGEEDDDMIPELREAFERST